MSRTLNMTAVTENVDATDVLSETSTVVTATAMGGVFPAFLLEDISGDILGTDFTIKFVMGLNSSLSTTGASHITATMKNHVVGNDWLDDILNVNETYSITATETTGSTSVHFDEFHNVGAGPVLLDREIVAEAGDTENYYEWTKVGTAATLDAWTDSGKGTHISGYPAAITLTNNSEMPNLFPISNLNDGGEPVAYRTIGPMTIDFGAVVVAGGQQGSYFIELQGKVW